MIHFMGSFGLIRINHDNGVYFFENDSDSIGVKAAPRPLPRQNFKSMARRAGGECKTRLKTTSRQIERQMREQC